MLIIKEFQKRIMDSAEFRVSAYEIDVELIR